MGKKSKEHRKKVLKRRNRLTQQANSKKKKLQEVFEKVLNENLKNMSGNTEVTDNNEGTEYNIGV